MAELAGPTLQARNRLIILLVLICLLDAALIALARDLWAIARLLITIGVMYFTVQGRKWAKWLLIALLSLTAVGLIALLLALRAELSMLLIVGSGALVALNAIAIINLIANPSLKRYFAWKRNAVPSAE